MSTSEAVEKNSAHLEAIHHILCPNCSAEMMRDSSLGVMKCSYCGTTTAAIANDAPRMIFRDTIWKAPLSTMRTRSKGKNSHNTRETIQLRFIAPAVAVQLRLTPSARSVSAPFVVLLKLQSNQRPRFHQMGYCRFSFQENRSIPSSTNG
jgi:ribosomal protein L37AE/L43A